MYAKLSKKLHNKELDIALLSSINIYRSMWRKRWCQKAQFCFPFNCQFSLWDQLPTTWTICLSRIASNCPLVFLSTPLNEFYSAHMIHIDSSKLLSEQAALKRKTFFLDAVQPSALNASYRPSEFVWECFLCEKQEFCPCVTQHTFILCDHKIE